jgi:hypothetical protein
MLLLLANVNNQSYKTRGQQSTAFTCVRMNHVNQCRWHTHKGFTRAWKRFRSTKIETQLIYIDGIEQLQTNDTLQCHGIVGALFLAKEELL